MHKQAKVFYQPEGAVAFTMVQQMFARNPFWEFCVSEKNFPHDFALGSSDNQ